MPIYVGDRVIESGEQLKDFLGPKKWKELCADLAETLAPRIMKNKSNKN